MNRRKLTSQLLVIGLVATGVAVTGCTEMPGTTAETGRAFAEQIALTHELTVFRSPTCGCCGLWIDHMKAAGFQVKDQITEDMTAVKQQYGVPTNLVSCHTTLVEGYVVEGHIPAEDVIRLLTERPEIAGIAVPGMPIGSPGMESGDYVEPYTVFSFQADGSTEPFSEHS
jgi:hypothetical protein